MPKILFLVPDESRLAFVTEIFASSFPDIKTMVGDPTTVLGTVKWHLEHGGVEVVAARTTTAATLRASQLKVSVVEIPLTSVDIIRAIHEAKIQWKNIALIVHSGEILGVDFFSEILGVSVRQYAVDYKPNLEDEVRAICDDGADVILGGLAVVRAATQLGIPRLHIKFGKEGVLQAAQEARQIQQALEIEAAKREFLSTIVDYSSEGILTIDKEHIITAFNPAAQKIVNINEIKAVGQPIQSLLPQMNLDKIADDGREQRQSIINLGSVQVLCHSKPIMVNGKSFGAVATFQEIGKIQQMEAKIRQEMYAQGHFAKLRFDDILGNSPAITEAIETAQNFAATSSNILITGETGTGKEIFAQSIHNASNRYKGPFVAINCASLPSQILESELFGYVAGAFTGAKREGKVGLFEVAHRGTLFLDEIAEMDYANQGRLLRFLQEKTIVRLGSNKVIPVDVRIIAATNKDLNLMVRENKFRNDLFFRLNVLNLELPALRTRKSDIPIYAEAFFREFSAGSGKKFRLDADALRVLEQYPWPGNIREFRNVIERVIATSKTEILTKNTLMKVLSLKKQRKPGLSPKEMQWADEIKRALAGSKGNYTAAAAALGISRTTLWRRLRKLKIE